MEVTFYRFTEARVSYWEAVRGARTRVPGSMMALGRGGLPHDLAQLVVEATLGLDRGFWGSVAAGATFRSTGRRRNQPGREVIRRNKAALDESERLAGEHLRAALAGDPTPCAGPLAAMSARWDAVGDGEGMATTWPDLADRGTVGPVRAQDLTLRR